MVQEAYNQAANAASTKVALLKRNPAGYLALSMLAGVYVGFGVLLAFTIGGMLTGQPYLKIAMGLSFGVALSLVVMAGAELFTGNNLVMAAGVLRGKITLGDAVKLWCVCWVGNLLGALALVAIYQLTGLGTGAVGEFMAAGAAAKMSAGAVPLLARGVLCNVLVCLAVWCGFRCKTESGKLMMIFWCLFAFITTGFEHSIANMTLMAIALLNPFGQAVSLGGYIYNLAVVTVGNVLGGVLLAAVYYLAAAGEGE